MQTGMKNGLIVLAIIIISALAGMFIFKGKTTAPLAPEVTQTETTGTTEAPAVQAETKTAADGALLASPSGLTIDIAKAMADRSIGDDEAKVTIIEYASLTCSHCAEFHNKILTDVKKKLIETGKARLVFRDFPLDNYALRAAMMTRCAPTDKYFDLVEVLFANQEKWAKADEPLKSIKQLGALAGMDEAYIDACMNSKELEEAMLKSIQDAQTKYQVKATPTFTFNEGAETFSGAQPVEKFEEAVTKVSEGK